MAASAPTTTPIKNVVVIFGENISFDHYFATYPNAANTGAAGEPSFTARAGTPSIDGIGAPPISGSGLQGDYVTNNLSLNLAGTGTVQPVRLTRAQATTCDMNHNYTDEQIAYHGGQVDNFVRAVGAVPSGAGAAQQYCLSDQSTVLGYFDGNTVQAMWNYAQHFALNDNAYGTTYGPTTLGHVNLISGNTHGVVGTTLSNVTVYSINTKTGAGETSVVTVAGGDVDVPSTTAGAGTSGGGGTMVGDIRPFGDDCASSASTQGLFGSSGRNVGDLLNAKGLSWGWFGGGFRPTSPYTAGANQPPASAANAAIPGNAAQCSSIHEAADGTVKVDYAASQEPFQLYTSTQNLHHLAPASSAEIGNPGPANHQYDVGDLFNVTSVSGATSRTYTINGLKAGVVLPAVTFIKAPTFMTAHAQYSNPLLEQQFVTQVINSLMQSSYWPNMAIILTYDDSDGWYDHVVPPLVNPSQTSSGAATESSDALTGNSGVAVSGGTVTELPSGVCGVPASGGAVMGRCGYGPRLPFLIVSPFAKLNFVDHTLIDQSSVLRFIEDNWSLGRINPSPTPVSQGGSFDQIAGSLLNMFNFTQRHSLNGLILNPSDGTIVSGANDL